MASVVPPMPTLLAPELPFKISPFAVVEIIGLPDDPVNVIPAVEPEPAVTVPDIFAIPVTASALEPMVAPFKANDVPVATPRAGVVKVGLVSVFDVSVCVAPSVTTVSVTAGKVSV